MYAAAGNCHVYVHADADLEMARRIAVNAKAQRPGVCNSAETLLIDAAIAERFTPAVLSDLSQAGVELVGDERARAFRRRHRDRRGDRGRLGHRVPRPEDGCGGRQLGRGRPVEHVNAHGTGHSEAIVTGSGQAADEFAAGVDFGRRLHQRLDSLHRRLRVRDGRRDRQLDPEAARPRPDRDARADDLQVRWRAATARCVSSSAGAGHRGAGVGLQPAAPRPPGAGPGGALAARPQRGDPGPDRRRAAQADRRRSRSGSCGWR